MGPRHSCIIGKFGGYRLLDEPIESSIHRSLRADAIERQIQGIELVRRHPILARRLADVSEPAESIAGRTNERGTGILSIQRDAQWDAAATGWTELLLMTFAVQFELLWTDSTFRQFI